MIPYSSCQGCLTDSLKRKLAININSLGSRTHGLELTIIFMITGLFLSIDNDMPSCKKEIQRSLFKLSVLSCSQTNGEVKPFMTADFLRTFF